MPDDFEDEMPRKKKKGKTIFTRKRLSLILAVLVIFSLGAAFQHYYLEPLQGDTMLEKYTRCLSQKEVLDQRFASCATELQDINAMHKACEFQLNQCQQA